MNVEAIRNEFPILHQQVNNHPLIYFDNAASSQKPVSVIRTISEYYERDNANVHRGLHTLSMRTTTAFENARRTVARYINAAHEEEIIFTRGTTEGINLLAYAWGLDNLKAGDVIITTEMEHHSNLVPWQMLARRTGAKVEYLRVNPETAMLDLEPLPKLLKSGAKLLAMTHISNSVGIVNPVEEVCRMAREHGVLTMIDAAQSAGHRVVDVQKIGCDFLVFSGHKVCGPTGIGVFYGRRELLNQMAPYHGGGEMIVSVKLEGSEYKEAPHRFEAGTPDIAGAIGLAAALDYLNKIGRDHIQKYDEQLAEYAYKRLSELENIRIIGPATGRAGLVSFQFNDIHAHDVVTLADQKGLALRGGHHCTQPLMHCLGLKSTARASFYFYNTMQEIDSMIDIMRQTREFSAVELDELYQELVLDHSKRPRNFGHLANATASAKGNNPSCGDEIELQIRLGENDTIEEIAFTGQGCTISQATASMLTAQIKGKSKQEALDMYVEFLSMLTSAEEPPAPKFLGNLRVLKGVRKFPQRVKCATLSWQALRRCLLDPGSTCTSESQKD